MTPQKCPGCGAKLSPEMFACPNCPMSFPEDYGSPESVNPLKQSPYFRFVLPVLFFAGIGAMIWGVAMGLMRLGEDNSKSETPNFLRSGAPSAEEAEKTAEGGGQAGPGGASAAAGGGDADAPKAPAEPVASFIQITPAAASDVPEKNVKPAREWKLRGYVYDLTTLKPLAGCVMLFTDEQTNARVQTRTDSTGRYRAIVPPLGDRGYAVAIEKGGYAASYLDPGTDGVREMTESRRRETARDLATTLTAAPATVQGVSEEPVVTDFYLAPRP